MLRTSPSSRVWSNLTSAISALIATVHPFFTSSTWIAYIGILGAVIVIHGLMSFLERR